MSVELPDLTQLARYAGLHVPVWNDDKDPKLDPPSGWAMVSPCGPALERFARAVSNAALERAAQECNAQKSGLSSEWGDGHDTGCDDCYAAIRALKTNKEQGNE